MKAFLNLTAVILVAIVALFMVTRPVQATEFNICNIFPWLAQCQPQPTPSPSPSPSVEPTPTPIPCEQTEEGCGQEEPEATPTPIPLTQGAEGCSQDCSPSYNPPVCNGLYAEIPVFVHVDRVNSTEVKIQWASNNADRFALIYGYVDEGTLPYGIPSLNGDSREVNIGQLDPNRAVNVQLYAYRGECSVSSRIIHP